MNIHTWGLCLIGTLGITACGSDGGDDVDGSAIVANVNVTTVDHVRTDHVVTAWFSKGRFYGPGSTCTESHEGTCKITSCDGVEREDPKHPPVFYSAGPIAISGAQIPADVVIRPDDGNHYRDWAGHKVAWAGGESIRIAAEGNFGGVPAFEARLPAPSLITLAKPYWGDESLVVDRSKDLEVAWAHSGAASGAVDVVLTADSGDTVECAFPVKDGAAVVPPSVLGKLRQPSTGSIRIGTSERRTVTAGSWPVEVALRTEGSQKDRRFASGSVKFQ